MTIGSVIDRVVGPVGRAVHADHMRRLGLTRSMRMAKAYNRMRYGHIKRAHFDACHNDLDELLEENGWSTAQHARVEMHDGWAIDTSGTLPHLEELLAVTDRLIEERGGVDGAYFGRAQQPYFYLISQGQDQVDYPPILNFILSSEVLSAVARYMRTIPVMSRTKPPGARIMESTSRFDPDRDGPLRESQFYHLDHHDQPVVYVIVLLKDVTLECGPWTFLSRSVSDRVVSTLKYRDRGEPYRVTDDRMYECVDETEKIVFAYPKGSVLFIDSGRCFHYGSRNADVPRYQMMYAMTTPCRTDFTETIIPAREFPISESDSRLRKMVLGSMYRGIR